MTEKQETLEGYGFNQREPIVPKPKKFISEWDMPKVPIPPKEIRTSWLFRQGILNEDESRRLSAIEKEIYETEKRGASRLWGGIKVAAPVVGRGIVTGGKLIGKGVGALHLGAAFRDEQPSSMPLSGDLLGYRSMKGLTPKELDLYKKQLRIRHMETDDRLRDTEEYYRRKKIEEGKIKGMEGKQKLCDYLGLCGKSTPSASRVAPAVPSSSRSAIADFFMPPARERMATARMTRGTGDIMIKNIMFPSDRRNVMPRTMRTQQRVVYRNKPQESIIKRFFTNPTVKKSGKSIFSAIYHFMD